MSDDLLLLSEVCGQYFGLTERMAQRKAADGRLPVPAFRISGTRKGPFHIRKCDLDAHVQQQYDKAKQLNSNMRHAGLV